MKHILIAISFISIMSASCTHRRGDKAYEQVQIDDSLATTPMIKADRDNPHLLRLKDLRAEYVGQRARLNRSYERRERLVRFHIARSEEDKQAAIKKENLYIYSLEDSMKVTAKAMWTLERKLGAKSGQ